MARAVDPGHFFQTESSLSEISRKAAKAKNKAGDPIRLSSKILAVVADPVDAGRVYVGESAGVVRRVVLDTGDARHVYQGPSAPVACVTLDGGGKHVIAGCWDKRIWAWDSASRAVRRTFSGHTDFVKAVLYVEAAGHRGRELLISGGADANIIVWDFQSAGKIHLLKGHVRGVLSLALDPVESDDDVDQSSLVFFSAGSDREIRRWSIPNASGTSGSEIASTSIILAHETSINRLRFDADGDLWTASSDKTSQCLSRAEAWRSNTEFVHPDFVRDVVIDETAGKIITACRDEDIRVWDRGTGKLHHTFRGHYEEVTALTLLLLTTGKRGKKVLVSVSIDGTIRRWSLQPEDLLAAKAQAEEEEHGDIKDRAEIDGARAKGEGEGDPLTEEERRVLDELMLEEDE